MSELDQIPKKGDAGRGGRRAKGKKISVILPQEAVEQLRRLQTVYNLSQSAVLAQAIGKAYLSEPLAWSPAKG